MLRNAAFDAVVLRSKEVPSGARVVTLLSAEEGLTEAFVFGGGKSKLRSLASPWHAGRAWIYRDTAKNLIKLSDFDARTEYANIRLSLKAIGAASFASELLTATSALGGDSGDAFEAMTGVLAALDEATVPDAASPEAADEVVDRVLVAFTLSALGLMGVLPDPNECSSCAGVIRRDTVHSYSRRSGGYLCEACASVPDDARALVVIPPGALAWMEACRGLSDAARTGLARESLAAIKAAALDMARKAVDAPLKTLESGLL